MEADRALIDQLAIALNKKWARAKDLFTEWDVNGDGEVHRPASRIVLTQAERLVPCTAKNIHPKCYCLTSIPLNALLASLLSMRAPGGPSRASACVGGIRHLHRQHQPVE